MQTYPHFLFHATKAPEGQLFKTPESDPPESEGWVDTPAKFDPHYKAPPQTVEPGTVPAEAAAAGFIPQPYPAWRHNATGDSVLVQTAEADEALDATVWKASPADFKKPAESLETQGGAPAPTVSETEANARKTELYATPVGTVLKVIADTTDQTLLATLRGYEVENPSGARGDILTAVDERMVALLSAKRLRAKK